MTRKKRNTHLWDADSNGFIEFGAVNRRWAIAKDVVDYPVFILPAYYIDPKTKKYVNANGHTITGRNKEYCLVVVDKYRTNDRQVIATVSSTYGSLATTDVYDQLQQELVLAEQKHQVERLYVSANGGTHQLTVRMLGMITMAGIPDKLNMMIRLNTSVDGTRAHSLSMIINNKTGDTDIHAYGGNYNLSARHTKTIGERSAYYIPTIQAMVDNWNEVIIPSMSMMFDCKFKRNVALELVSSICKESNMGERHAKNIRELYASKDVKTKGKKDTLYRVSMAVNQYIDENLADMHETKQKFKDATTASIQKNLKRLMK